MLIRMDAIHSPSAYWGAGLTPVNLLFLGGCIRPAAPVWPRAAGAALALSGAGPAPRYLVRDRLGVEELDELGAADSQRGIVQLGLVRSVLGLGAVASTASSARRRLAITDNGSIWPGRMAGGVQRPRGGDSVTRQVARPM